MEIWCFKTNCQVCCPLYKTLCLDELVKQSDPPSYDNNFISKALSNKVLNQYFIIQFCSIHPLYCMKVEPSITSHPSITRHLILYKSSRFVFFSFLHHPFSIFILFTTLCLYNTWMCNRNHFPSLANTTAEVSLTQRVQQLWHFVLKQQISTFLLYSQSHFHL